MTGASSTMPVAVVARGLTKTFGQRAALVDLDLQIGRGECVGLRGRNSGRTTLLRIAATLVRPSAGTLAIYGADVVRRVYDVRGQLAYVGGDAAPTRGLRVNEYLQMIRSARAGAHGSLTVADTIDRASLAASADVDSLSAALRRRLTLAAALMTQPDVALLDDPFVGMDAIARAGFVDWVLEARDRGTTILIASDDEGDMKRVCDRVITLAGGRIH